MANVHILPSGKLTRSFRRYYRAWKSLARPIEKATGTKLFGFDPAFSFTTPDWKYSFQMGLYEVRLLAKKLTNTSPTDWG